MRYIFRKRALQGEQPIQIALTGDNNSNNIIFEIERYYNGIDLSAYAVQLLLKGSFMPDPQEDIVTDTTGLTITINGGRVSVKWTVANEYTYLNGIGTAQFRFIGSGEEVWHSDVFSLSVGTSMNIDGTVEEQASSIIVSHTAKILALQNKTDNENGAFALKGEAYAKDETYNKTEIDAEKARITDLEEETADLNTVLAYNSATAKSGELDSIKERVDFFEDKLQKEGVSLNRIDAIDNTLISQASSILILDETKLEKKPNGSASLINEIGKLNMTYVPDALLGSLKYGGTFGSNGLIVASEDFITLHGEAIASINVVKNKGAYFICNGDYTFYGISFNSGDKAICQGNTGSQNVNWVKVDNTDAVTSINGKTGEVLLIADEINYQGDYGDVQEAIDDIINVLIPAVDTAKVDKDGDKVLSTNDFTNEEKAKIATLGSASMKQNNLSYIRLKGRNSWSSPPAFSLTFPEPPIGKKTAAIIDWGDGTLTSAPENGGQVTHEYAPHNIELGDYLRDDFLVTVEHFPSTNVWLSGFGAKGSIEEVQWGKYAGHKIPEDAFRASQIKKCNILPMDTGLSSYTGVNMEIGDFAFFSSNLEECNMPTVKKIGMNAFFSTNLKSIDLSSVIDIGPGAFSGCIKLTTIIYNGSVEWNEANMGDGAFGDVKAVINTTNDSFITMFLARGGELLNKDYSSDIGELEDALTNKADLVGGKIPESQLPSYVDDVLEFATLATFPKPGESGKIYVAIDTNKTYRWGGSSYIIIASDLSLGETSDTAYRGDMGKIAYDHSQEQGNPHGVTKTNIGLGNVDNTSDNDKPISSAQETALSLKVDREEGKGLSTTDYTETEKSKLATISENADVSPIPEDAISDGKTYGRKDGQWAEVSGGGSSGTSDYNDLENKPIESYADADYFPLIGDINTVYKANGKSYKYRQGETFPDGSSMPEAYPTPGTGWASEQFEDDGDVIKFAYVNLTNQLMPLPMGLPPIIYMKVIENGVTKVIELFQLAEGGQTYYMIEDGSIMLGNNNIWVTESFEVEQVVGSSFILIGNDEVNNFSVLSASINPSGETVEGGYYQINALTNSQLAKVNKSMSYDFIQDIISDDTETLTGIGDMFDYDSGMYLFMSSIGSAMGIIDNETMDLKINGISNYVEIHYDGINGWQNKGDISTTIKIYKIGI